MLTKDFSLVGFDAPVAIPRDLNAYDRSISVNLSAHIAGSDRQSLCQVCRLYVTIVWMLYRTNQSLGITQRPNMFDVGGC